MTARSLAYRAYRRPELTLCLGLLLGCSKQSEPEVPQQQAYPPQSPYPQQPGQYPQQPGQYPQQPGQYPQQPGQYPQQPEQYPQQPQQYPQQPGQYPQQPAPGTTPAPAQPSLPGLPPAGPLPGAAPSGPQATAIDPSLAAPVQPILTQLAASKATPGAKPIGSVMAANFQQGQQLEAQVQLEPGKCYTVVGAALPTVTELDIKLVGVLPIAGMAPVLAVDNTSGAQAVLGEKPNCYKWALPAAPVKIIVTATGGSGLAAAQLFGK